MRTKVKRVLALALALSLVLALPVFAAGSGPSYGVYNVQAESGYTLTPLTADGTADTAVTDDVGDVYKNTVKFTLSLSFAGEADAQYVVFLLNGETEVPTETNIRYIDQQGTTGTTVEFSIYPDTLAQAGEYAVYISGTNAAYQKVASFDVVLYYTLGDVNEDGGISAMDASLVLQYVARLITLDEAQIAAADVSGDGSISAMDASLILQKVARLIETFPAGQ